MRKTIVLLALVLLPVAGALAGWFSAPLFARTHYRVQLADSVRAELANPALVDSDEYESFLKTRARAEDVYAESRRIVGRFRIGGAVAGAWTGLVFGLAAFGFNRTRRREIYEIDYEMCVACTRCFSSCPREHLRRKGRAEDTEHSSGDPS